MNELKESEIRLAAGVSRWMESGDPTIKKGYLMPFVGNDIILLNQILDQWNKQGFIVWKKDASNLELDEQVVRFGRFPLTHVLWPAPLKTEEFELKITADLYNDGKFIGVYPYRQKSLIEKYMPDVRFLDK